MNSIILRMLFIFAVVVPFSANATKTVRCFDKTYMSPLDLYREAYDQSQFLGWGLTSHTDFTAIGELAKFLDVVGEDERLRFIFVEYPYAATDFYEKISLGKPTSYDQLLSDLFMFYRQALSPEQQQLTVEANLINAKVAQLNQKRKTPILIRPINEEYGQYERKIESLSIEREVGIRENFLKSARMMASDEKAILLFHNYHITRKVLGNTKSYAGKMGQPSFRKVFGPVSFLGLTDISAESYRSIVFDQRPAASILPTLFRLDQKSTTLARVGSEATSACLSVKNYFEYYAEDVQYPARIANSFNYVVRFALPTRFIAP
jgi:hypothetical protein